MRSQIKEIFCKQKIHRISTAFKFTDALLGHSRCSDTSIGSPLSRPLGSPWATEVRFLQVGLHLLGENLRLVCHDTVTGHLRKPSASRHLDRTLAWLTKTWKFSDYLTHNVRHLRSQKYLILCCILQPFQMFRWKLLSSSLHLQYLFDIW